MDEIWGFVGAKAKSAKPEFKETRAQGDAWLWLATCADTKIVPCSLVGTRDAETANEFIDDLADRLSGHVQITNDGHKPYIEVIENVFGADVDYAMLVKMFGAAPESAKSRYSPAECCGIRKTTITGKPDQKLVSTS